MNDADKPFAEYLFSYNYDGSRWAFTMKAESAEDAKARVQRLQHATYDGELKAVIRVPGPLQRFTMWLLGR